MITECTCTPCQECEGSGHVWFSFLGGYLGRKRLDDMDEMEICEECGGSGLDEMCERCRDLMSEEEW